MSSINLPNILTVLRVLLTLAIIFCMGRPGVKPVIVATVLFMIASWTDFYDGYYAQKHNISTNFGKIVDPIADKFLILTIFFLFAQRYLIAYWMFYLIFAREVLVTGSRIKAVGRGQVLAAEKAGKLKTITQLFVIWLILLFMILQENGGLTFMPQIFFQGYVLVINTLMMLTVFLTVVSGLSYFWNNRKVILSPSR